MTTREILDYIRFYGNKNQKGNAYTPEDFNLSLKDFNMQIFNDELSRFLAGSLIPQPLKRFKVVIASGTLTTGVYTLPGDYQELITSTFTVTVAGVTKFGTFVDDSTAKRMINGAAYKLTENPIAVLNSGTIKVFPTNAASFAFEYLKVPTTPIYDYYIDDDLNEIYLVAGGAHTLASNEVGSAGQVAPTTVASLTAELDWDTIIHPRFVASILRPMGVNLREEEIVAVSQIKKQETR